MDEFAASPLEFSEKVKIIDAYLASLPREDRLYAAMYGANQADAEMRRVFARWSR